MQQNPTQKPGTGLLIAEAFFYWRKTIGFQVLFSLLYFSLFFGVVYYAAVKYGILDQYLVLVQNSGNDIQKLTEGYKTMMQSPEFMSFSWYVLGVMVFLYPLNLGFFKIFRKIDTKKQVSFEDLFAGYLGSNFFRYIGFYMFWIAVYSYAAPTFILGFLWVLVTLFSAPLMFYMNKGIFETISLSFKAIRMFFIEIIVCCLIAFMFKWFGVFTIIGAFFTFPFGNAMIYVLYKRIFNENLK